MIWNKDKRTPRHDLKKLGDSHVNYNKINDYTGVCLFVADYEAKYVYEIQRTLHTVWGDVLLRFHNL